MKKTANRLVLTGALVLFATTVAVAKSIVITLNTGTMVYYKLSSDASPRMILHDDGTFTMNGQEYAFDDVECFAYSATDYDGAEGTVDGVVSLDDRGGLLMKGEVRVYAPDGKLVSHGGNLAGLRTGTYIVSDGTTTLKIQKR